MALIPSRSTIIGKDGVKITLAMAWKAIKREQPGLPSEGGGEVPVVGSTAQAVDTATLLASPADVHEHEPSDGVVPVALLRRSAEASATRGRRPTEPT